MTIMMLDGHTAQVGWLFWRSAAAWRCSTFIRWIGWTLEMTCVIWQNNHKHWQELYYSTCPLQHLRLSFLRFCWSYSLEFTAYNSLRNPAVGPEQFRRTLKTHLFCLLLAFRWQCVRGVLRIRTIQMYIYLLTYLLTYLLVLTVSFVFDGISVLCRQICTSHNLNVYSYTDVMF